MSFISINPLNLVPTLIESDAIGDDIEPLPTQPAWNKGKKHLPESIQLMRESATGKKASEATKKKMSESRAGNPPWNKGKTGQKHTPETKKLLSEQKKGYKHKPESIQKMRESQTGVRVSEETKRKISRGLKTYNKNAKRKQEQENLL